jgi:hypothetical protein
MIIAGGGFALMAWTRARDRTGWLNYESVLPLPRERPNPTDLVAACYPEFYRILDNASTGFAALATARRLGMIGDRPTVKL